MTLNGVIYPRRGDPSKNRVQELCESGGGRPGLPVPNSPYGLCGRKATLNRTRTTCMTELRSCVKVEVDVLGFPFLIVPTVSVVVKQHSTELEPHV